MRLIDVRTLNFVDVNDETEEEYAILSHRWEREEISFQVYQKLIERAQAKGFKELSGCNKVLKEASSKQGFRKIRSFCQQADKDGHRFVWIDTCCINKDSSAELSEAINSMYRWYNASRICYVYLSDVEAVGKDSREQDETVKASQWFTRGWTLQEMLAPPSLVFLDKELNFLGTKGELLPLLSETTGISSRVFVGECSITECSIAQRMSWASSRATTRKEDMAYCLLGLFDVNMPLLYGEGAEKAFLRLQVEILKKSDDHTIFAWHMDSSTSGLLASSPKAFSKCSLVKSITRGKSRHAYSLTNRGLSIKLLAIPWALDIYLARLDCFDTSHPEDFVLVNEIPGLREESLARLGIFVKMGEDDQFSRVRRNGESLLQTTTWEWQDRQSTGQLRKIRPSRFIDMNIRQKGLNDVISSSGDFETPIADFLIYTPLSFQVSGHGRLLKSVECVDEPDLMETSVIMEDGEANSICYLDFSHHQRIIQVIGLGFDFDFNPVCFLADKNGIKDLSRRSGSVDDDQTLSSDYKVERMGIYQRNTSDLYGWSETLTEYRDRITNSSILCEVRNWWVLLDLKNHNGLWASKGNRNYHSGHSIDPVRLLNHSNRRDSPDVEFEVVANIRIRQIPYQKGNWQVHITEMRPDLSHS